MSVTPIFVSGIGRSGTSAVVSSLATHPSFVEIERVGEAPFVSSFLSFLVDFEDNSKQAEYNVLNYRLNKESRQKCFADFMFQIQCGRISTDADSDRFWITKASLTEENYDKAIDIFGQVRCVYIMRNGIEVINSARKFKGFSSLSFQQQCTRWVSNLEQCNYLSERNHTAIIKHDQLVKNPHSVYAEVYKNLEMPTDGAPAQWISNNIFNSSFDKTEKVKAISNKFENRLQDAWSSWTEEEKQIFIDMCDKVMIEYEFERPYTTGARQVPNILARSKSGTQEVDTHNPTNRKLSDKLCVAMKNRIKPLQFDYLYNISELHGYSFMNNPKVASTSILKQLQRYENSDAAKLLRSPHIRDESPLQRLSHYSADQQESLLLGTERKTFTFTRDPYSRVLSAYLSKIQKPLIGYKFDPSTPNVYPPKGAIISISTGKPVDESTDFSIEVSFDEFVEVICSQETIDMDVHWKPQYHLLLPDLIDYSYIGRFENLNKDLDNILAVIGVEQLNSLEFSKNKTNSNSKLSTYFNQVSLRKIEDRFAEDFEHFSYDDASVDQLDVA